MACALHPNLTPHSAHTQFQRLGMSVNKEVLIGIEIGQLTTNLDSSTLPSTHCISSFEIDKKLIGLRGLFFFFCPLPIPVGNDVKKRINNHWNTREMICQSLLLLALGIAYLLFEVPLIITNSYPGSK